MSVKYKQLTDKAFNLHENGRLKEAEEIYKFLIQVNPDDVNVLNLLGMLYISKGEYDNAITYLTRAIVLDDLPCIMTNLAKAYFYNNDYETAISFYNKSLEKEETDDTYYSLALLYKTIGDYKKSVNAYLNAIKCNPNNYNAYYNLALTLKILKSPQKAIEYCNKALKLRGDDIDLYILLSNLYESVGNYDSAINYLSNAIVLKPKVPVLHYNLGVLYSKMNNINKAAEYFNNVIQLEGKSVDVLINLGHLYKDTNTDKSFEYAKQAYDLDNNNSNVVILLAQLYRDKFDNQESIAVLNKFLEYKTDNAEVYAQLAVNYMDIGEYNAALDNYEKAIEISPHNLNYLHGKAMALKYLGKKNKATEILEYIVKTDPSIFQSAITLGMAYLTKKKFNEGMKLYSRRSLESKFTQRFNDKIWNEKTDISDKTILLYSDCGLGDTIMFSRYIPMLKEKCKRVIIQTDAEIMELLKHSYPDFDVINKSDNYTDYDIVMPIMNISYALSSNFDDIPFSSGYLKADENKIKIYSENELFKTDKLKVGIFYKGNKRVFKNRFIPAECITKLLDIENTQYYSLQVKDNDIKDDRFILLNDIINDYSDTAAILKNLDLVVTVDSSLVHVSGALGVDTLLLLPKISEWRWFNDEKNTPWYDSVTIYKQNQTNDWLEVIDRVSQEIINRAKQ